MLVRNWIGTAVVALLCVAIIPAAQAQAQYIGSESCGIANCHPNEFSEWKVSGHPYKLVPVDDARVRPIPLPSGHSVRRRYLHHRWLQVEGPLCRHRRLHHHFRWTPTETASPIRDGMNQYNMLTGNWVNYHPGELKPYNCGSCHTTGWVPDEDWETDGDLSDNQDGLRGCTARSSSAVCSARPVTGPARTSMPATGDRRLRGRLRKSATSVETTSTIPAKGGSSVTTNSTTSSLPARTSFLKCVTCHNPHKKSEFSIDVDLPGLSLGRRRLLRQDADGSLRRHLPGLPHAVRNQVRRGAGPYRGDVRTHLFSINTDADASLFTDDGGFVLLDEMGQAGVTLDFACMDCHPNRNKNWLAKNAKDFHHADEGGKTPPFSATGGAPSDFRGSRKSGG